MKDEKKTFSKQRHYNADKMLMIDLPMNIVCHRMI